MTRGISVVDFEQTLTCLGGTDHKGSESGNMRVLTLGMLEVDDAVKQVADKSRGFSQLEQGREKYLST
jgi:hypothetical protein